MKLWIVLIAVLVIGVALTSCSSSLSRYSEGGIRERILRDTPQGSTYTVVLNYATKKGWPATEEPRGFETKRVAQSPARVVGKRAIKAYLGGYQGLPWRKDVNVYWVFNERDKLVEVFVEKQADAP